MPRRIKLRELMSTELVTLDEDDTLADAQRCMTQGRIRHLPVVRGTRLVGLVTHRDLLAASFSVFADIDGGEQRRMFSAVPVAELMHRSVLTVGPDLPVADAARLLIENRFGCLPVVSEEGDLIGLVTEADFLRLVVRLLP